MASRIAESNLNSTLPPSAQLNIGPKVDDYESKEWMKSESNSCHRMIGEFVIKTVDFAVFAILSDADQDFTLGVSHFPTRPFEIKIGRTFFVNIFRAIH